jgi:hypothetical protein
MIDAPALISRLLALLAATALFAGMWSADRPVDAIALRHGSTKHAIVQREPEWIPLEESVRIAAPVADHVISTALTLNVGAASKTLTVESEGLAITAELLQQHLEQLPLGIPVGDYRIVDSLGGVGWLRVRSAAAMHRSASTQLLTTSLGGAQVQFIRIAPAVLGQDQRGITK